MLRRKIDKKLEEWLCHRKQALLIKGARQVGKTYSIVRFAESKFQNVIILDFSKQVDLIDGFARLASSEEVLRRLSVFAGAKMVPGQTLVFFDEVQLVYQRREELMASGALPFGSQDLLTAMKSLVEKGDYRFVLSGSMLGVTIKDVVLNPTGYLDEYTMFPLDFEEFLWAKGVGELAIDHVKECFEKKIPVDETVHRRMMEYFKDYVLVGGMPEAVDAFIKDGNLFHVQTANEQIIKQYLKDITLYIHDDEMKLRVREIYKAIPSQLSAKNARFISSQVLDKKYLKHKNVADEFLWLSEAGVAIPTYHVNEPVLPLGLSMERKTLKLFSSDVGLLIAQLVDTGIREKLLNDEKEINYGAQFENVVAQELNAHGFHDELFYYNSKKHGEVDFLISYKGEVLPIEVKSGKSKEDGFYDHSALNNLMGLYSYPMAFVLGSSNVQAETPSIWQLPIYMIDFVRKG